MIDYAASSNCAHQGAATNSCRYDPMTLIDAA